MNVQQEFKRNTGQIGNESALTSSRKYHETAQHDVVRNYKTKQLFLKEQLSETVYEVVLTRTVRNGRYCSEENS